MWTSRRMLLWVVGLVLCAASFGVYSYLFGQVDGLPPLPSALGPNVVDPPVVVKTPENIADVKLRQAFGADCPELKRAIKLEVRLKNMVMAADTFSIEDGKVKLAPFSIAIFGKTKSNGAVEINTVRSDVAFLTFDKPVFSISEISGRKINAGELRQAREPQAEGERLGHIGGVTIVNNRATSERDDDMSLFTPGPVYYQESLNRIWTREVVQLTDMQSKPKPTTVSATGMDVYLTTDGPAAAEAGPAARRAARAKQKQPTPPSKTPTVNGVDRIVLRADVDMHLWVDAKSGFLSGGKKPKAEPKSGPTTDATAAAPENEKPAQPEKAQVVIKTQGPFVYEVATDRARFDISQHPGPHPNHVTVTRLHEGGAFDQLVCDHLNLQFRRKNKDKEAEKSGDAPPPKAADTGSSSSEQLEIETAHATGNQVILTSDLEVLTAYGNDLTYDSPRRQTILKGEPEMVAMKDGNEIHAKEMVLTGMGDKAAQQATAKGPGRIEMLDRNTGTRPQHARWKDVLVFDQDGPYDVLTLYGDAIFEDREQGQMLQADVLKVWLEPEQPRTAAGEAAKAAAKPGNGSRRPQHIDARGHVMARAPELNIHDTDRLVVWFRDAPPEQSQLPPAATPETPVVTPQPSPPPSEAPRAMPEARPMPSSPPAAAAPRPAGTNARLTSNSRDSATATTDAAARPAAVPPATGETRPGTPPPAKPKQPIDLSARLVETFVVRSGNKNEMEKIWCEGNVRVHQDPAPDQDKGVDIRGQTLQVTRFPEGNILLVTGDLAEVHLDKLSILGPEVNIDQKENNVWVNGIGAMRMPSNRGFNGDPLERPSELTVHWNRNMFFNGKDAQFYGGIQAEQDNARLACQTMQVFLDRVVSLKEGNKGKQPAKVDKMMCDKSVRVEDTTLQEGNFSRYTRMESQVLSVDNLEGTAVAAGPGIVRILQAAAADQTLPGVKPTTPPPGSVAKPPTTELKLTRVTYLGRMFANNNTRTAIFYDNVEVVNLPSDDADLPIDLHKLPGGAMYMYCEQLKVYHRKEADGKTSQQMEAHRKAVVQAREFWGRADVIKYDESKECVVFEASEGNLATLFRVRSQGQPPEEIKAKKITYWRRTNEFKIDSGSRINIAN